MNPPEATESVAIAVEGGKLQLGGGLLAVVRPALDRLAPGGVLAVLSRSVQVRQDLPAWCKLEHHDYLSCDRLEGGIDRHLITRGKLSVPIGVLESNNSLPTDAGRPTAADVLSAIPMPERADASSGFAPRGAQLEPGRPLYPFSLVSEIMSPRQRWRYSMTRRWDRCGMPQPTYRGTESSRCLLQSKPLWVRS